MEAYGISGWGVMLLGMGVVFAGLVMLIYITKLMSALCAKKRKEAPAPAKAVQAEQAPAQTAIANRAQFVAAVASAIAVCMGTEPDGLRIHSIKQL
ncbi:OadG family protein [Christensenellaceae bacterium OttesenSCG-928-L17]|nr:OadG family protein [Christensenellaceae bacterium OttesenSCG-928-L17]